MTKVNHALRKVAIAGLLLISAGGCAQASQGSRVESWRPVGCTVLAIRGVEHCYASTDNDHDGVPDAYETALLDRYRPFYRFSDDDGPEPYRPLDPMGFLRRSSLIGVSVAKFDRGIRSKTATMATSTAIGRNPRVVLEYGGIDAVTYASADAAACGFTALLPPEGADFLHGAPWSQVLAAGNIGLFGHVRQLGAPGQYAVEYWQFFGYNIGGGPWGIGNHEGDWNNVQVVVQPADAQHEVLRTTHSHHGDVDTFTFRDQNGRTAHTQGSPFAVPSQGRIVEYRSSDQAVQMFAPQGQSLFLHPVVYLEHGGHEFWPTTGGSKKWAHNHNGRGHQLLTQHVPNLGEVSAPLSDEAAIITRFTGYWGYRNSSNAPPPGPSLHKQWHWGPSESRLQRQVAPCAES